MDNNLLKIYTSLRYKLYISFFFILTLSCNTKREKQSLDIKIEETKTKNDWDFKGYLIEQTNYGLKELNLKSIIIIKDNALRIWRFPGGGAGFEEMYEFNFNTSELKLNSYIPSGFSIKEKNELSDLQFTQIIRNQEIKNKIKGLIPKLNLEKTKNSDAYCESAMACGDTYLVQYKTKNNLNEFVVNEEIKNCSNEEADQLKIFFTIIEELVEKYGH